MTRVNIRDMKVIDSMDLDQLVRDTYGRPYNFQQQDGCQDRGYRRATVPEPDPLDFDQKTIPEVINEGDMGVSFAAWLARDPEAPVGDRSDDLALELFWERNFYPSQAMVLNDLHARGLLPAGEYMITIDW